MEQRINELVSELLQKYRAVQAHLDRASEPIHFAAQAEQLAELKSTLDEAKFIEQQLFPLRDQFALAGGELSQQTQSLIEQSIAIVTRLLPQLGSLEKQAQIARQNLEPQIHDGVRLLKMQNAYARNY
jgi:hypothetical protein